MKGTATAGTGTRRDIARDIFAREAIWEQPTSWCSGADIIDAGRQRRLHPGNVDIEVFEPEPDAGGTRVTNARMLDS